MNLEEIALRVAEEIGAVAYSPPPMRAVSGYSFTFERLEAYAHALLAELSNEGETKHPAPIPEGYVLVPIDPEGQWSNDDIINIMVYAYQDCNGGYYDSMLAAYKALLAAARSE